MKANELRIGNYLHKVSNTKKSRNIFQLGIVNIVNVYVRNVRWDGNNVDFKDDTGLYRVEPIPLTEQWLIDLGAKNAMDIYYIGDIGIVRDGEGWTIIIRFIVTEDKRRVTRFKEIPRMIGYVHQYQNVIYELTGKELIKK